MENTAKKELIAKYKQRQQVGGICIIRNTVTGKIVLKSTADIQGSINNFVFHQKIGSCPSGKMQKDFTEFGISSFSFEVLEELKKGVNQADEEFKADIKLLEEIWTGKLADENLY